jgi:hemoglobin/transferrin/lactoferrin receptor protein
MGQCFFIFLVSLVGWGQTLHVVDGQTGQPVELVVISDLDQKIRLVTDAKGQAVVDVLSAEDQVVLYRLGYQTLTLRWETLFLQGYVVTLTPSPLHHHEVVKAKSRWKQRSEDVPGAVVAILPRQRDLQAPQTAADLLALSGQVFIQKSQQGGGSPMIRGFAANRLLYAVDGVRMNTAIFRSGNLQNVISLDAFAMEDVEVVFGPNSVQYGSDAIGGVMSFQTLTPKLLDEGGERFSGLARSRYASANQEQTGHAHAQWSGNRFAMLTSVSGYDFDHLKQGHHGPEDYVKPTFVRRENDEDVVVLQDDPLLQIPSGYDQFNFMQKFRWTTTSQWDVQLAFHQSDTSPYGRYDRHNRIRNGLPRYGEWDYGPQQWQMALLTLHHFQKTAWYDQMMVRLAAQTFEESRIDRNFNDHMRFHRQEQVDAYSLNLDFEKKWQEKHTFFYGVELVHNRVHSTGSDEDLRTQVSVPGPSRYPEADWDSRALFVAYHWHVTPQWRLQSGLRWNQYELDARFSTEFYPFPFERAQTKDEALTGSVGVVFQPNDRWRFSSTLASAFRAPNVDDMGKVFDSEPGSVVVPNPDLKAETAISWDAQVSRLFGNWGRLDLSAYVTDLDDAMVRRDFNLNGEEFLEYDGVLSRVQAIQNAAKAEVIGAQLSLQAKAHRLKFSGDVNYQEGEEELDDGSVSASRHAAPWFGILRIGYESEELTLQLEQAFQGEQSYENLAEEERAKDEIYAKDENGNNYAPSWAVWHFKGRIALGNGVFLGFGLENLTDRRYRPYSSGISGAGRSVLFSLEARF